MWIAAEFVDFFQPTIQPTNYDVLCDFRVFWQSPRSCKFYKTYSCCSETAALGNVRSITVAISSAALNTTMTHARLCIP